MNKTNREEYLAKIDVGDIFHAQSLNGARLACLATSITGKKICSRVITTQVYVEFDAISGEGQYGKYKCRIDSIAPLPVDIHNTMLGIDRKSRLEFEEDRFRLTESEKKALLFLDAHYDGNQL